jgi:hypothetical protein
LIAPDPYAPRWARLRAERLVAVAIVIGIPVAAMLMTVMFQATIAPNGPWTRFALLPAVVMAFSVRSVVRSYPLVFWCPRCNGRFLSWWAPWARRCQQCGIALGTHKSVADAMGRVEL